MVTGRKKDLIITAAGKNIAPVLIEDMLSGQSFIDRAVVIGDKRPYLIALVLSISAPWRSTPATSTLLWMTSTGL